MDLPENVHVLPDSNALRVLMTTLRNKETGSPQFRHAAGRISRLLAAAALESHPVDEVEIDTPLERTTGWALSGRSAIVPILRAGHALTDAFYELLPDPFTWQLGLSRDHETLRPSEYNNKSPLAVAPDITCFVNDPMLATGGSAEHAVRMLKERGARRVVFVGVVGAPDGIAFLHELHPDVPVHLATVEEGLNDMGYIRGRAIGDFGDRYYHTF